MIFGIVLLDDAMRIRQANAAAESYLQESAFRLHGRFFFDLMQLDDELVIERMSHSEEGITVRRIPVTVAQRQTLANITVTPLDDDRIHSRGRVVTFSDAGHVWQDSEHRTQASLQTAAVLAHEIKNPLAAIKGASQMLARRAEGRDAAMTDIIRTEVDRLTRLVDRMATLGSERPIETRPCNVHQIIRRALDVLTAGGTGHFDVVEEFDPSLPEVAANDDALQQVLINLLSNANDACSASRSDILTIRTRYRSDYLASADRNGRIRKLPVEIAVVDTGPGVPEAMIDGMFEPYVTNKANGQGLGLPLVRKLMHDMGGAVRYRRDSQHKATVFTVHLALADQGTAGA